MAQPDPRGVALAGGETVSSLFHRVLFETSARFPDLAGIVPEDAKAFRSRYARVLVDFEAARLASSSRAEIARFAVERAQASLELVDDQSTRLLADALGDPAEARSLRTTQLAGKGRLVPRVPYHGRVYTGAEVRDLAQQLVDAGKAAPPVVAAMDWLLANALDEAGEIDLAGRRFAVLGAAAEIAPTPLLLEAGADVLWIDTAAPPETLAKDSTLSGRLFAPTEPIDLLLDPCAAAATLRSFASEGPIDVGLYAYAPGRGREWRLAGAMNAVVDSLPAGAVRTAAVLVSPTTPVRLRPETLEAAEKRHAERPLWQKALESAGAIGPGRVGEEGAWLLRNVVSIQGPGYQAAQYFGKTLAADRWLTSGPTGASPIAVSANTAAITMTRSLRHPVFEAAFLGAPAFGVEAFEPDTTRALNGLLLIHDLLNPGRDLSEAQRLDRVLAQQVHGGVFALPYEMEPTIRVAAVIGLGKSPGKTLGFVRALVGR